ncbi:hypothetical protein [Roseomonas mucosa]|nr:hypothetical protein [Acetobacteraceae bacterium]
MKASISKPAAPGSAAPKVIDRLPAMRLADTVTLWRNALRILHDAAKRPQHAQASLVLAAIRQEWTKRRGRAPVPGDYFDWPGTDARPGYTELDTEQWLKHGVLQFVGYKVGNTDGEPQGVRERILSELFSGPIPPAFPPAYLDEWGKPGSSARLKKMADTIAALARNAKRRRDARMMFAIRDWERDLEYLYLEYYVGHFQFDWPLTAI